MREISDRLRAVQTPVIPVVGELVRAHAGAISLGQGVVHYAPPDKVYAAIQRFHADPRNHLYQAVQGIKPLRDAIDHKLAQDNRIMIGDGQRVIVTAGGNMAFINAVLAIADPGDEVILLVPYYFNHEMAVRIAGCKVVAIATDDEYQPCIGQIATAITNRTRAVVTISPNNPSGAVIAEATLRQINSLCADRGIYHIHDEAYEYFVYGDTRHFSPGAIVGAQKHTISLFSLSKSYGFASWRIGYMVIPSFLETPIKKIQDTILICPPVVCQFAAIGAMETGSSFCRHHVQALDRVRSLVRESLDQLGSACHVPRADGAFYYLLQLDCDLDPMALVHRLIKDYGVAAIPGNTFGLDGCTLRISYGALKEDRVAEGIGRLVRGLHDILCGRR